MMKMMMGGGSSIQEEEVLLLIQKVTELYNAISKLPNLRPSTEVDTLFSDLVLTCIPPSPIDVSDLTPETQHMRSNLINICSQAEGFLESHYSDILTSHRNPLDHLTLFPYHSNYLKLSLLEHTLLSRHSPRPPSRVAFVGSGPLPLTSVVLATRHLRAARFVNYDSDQAANERARALVAADPDLSARIAFRTADILDVGGEELRGYEAVFLAALVGVGREEKARVLTHLARQMAPGAMLVVRSARGARAFLYPVVDPCDLRGFEVLSVYHPEDEVINSVIVARRSQSAGQAVVDPGHGGPMMIPCKCCEIPAFNSLGHGGMMEEMALEEQIS